MTTQQINDSAQRILASAITLGRTKGYQAMTRNAVADHAGVARGLVNRYYGTVDDLRARVMVEAVKQRILTLVAQGIAHGDSVALEAPAELREEALRAVGVGV